MSNLDWNHCPACGAALPSRAAGVSVITCEQCGFVDYGNPSPTTVALIVNADRQLLLARRARPPREGFWDTIGGFLDAGETAEQCLAREVREELHVGLEQVVPLASYASTYGETGRATVGFAFACTLEPDSVIELSDENREFSWFNFNNLPELAFADGRDSVADLVDQWPAIAERLGF